MGDVSLSAEVIGNRSLRAFTIMLDPGDAPSSAEKVARWVPPLVVAALIFAGSSVRGDQIPVQLLSVPDKLAHFLEYFALAATLVPAMFASWSRSTRTVLAAIVLSILFGVSDEVHQMSTAGRDSSVWDLAADAVGSAAGALSVAWIAARARNTK